MYLFCILGMLEFLTGESPQAQLLRQIFVIYIVPILNPDGVVYGNNRCALAGEMLLMLLFNLCVFDCITLCFSLFPLFVSLITVIVIAAVTEF